MESLFGSLRRYNPPKRRRIQKSKSRFSLSHENSIESEQMDIGSLQRNIFNILENYPHLEFQLHGNSEHWYISDVQFSSLFSDLLSHICDEMSYESVTDNAYFVLLSETLDLYPEYRKKLGSLAAVHISSIPLVLLYALHLNGVCHYEDTLSQLIKGTSSSTCTHFSWEKLSSNVIDSFLSFVVTNVRNPSLPSCQWILNGIMDQITSETTSSEALLKALIPILSSDETLLLQLASTVLRQSSEDQKGDENATKQDWSSCIELKDGISKHCIDFLFRSVPPSILVDHLISLLIAGHPIVVSKFKYLVKLLSPDVLWETLFMKLKEMVTSCASTPVLKLLDFSYYLCEPLYYNMIHKLAIEIKHDAKTLFEIILQFLTKLPSSAASEHANKLKPLRNSAVATVFQDFSTQVTQLLMKRDAPVPDPSTTSNTQQPHEALINKWIKSFEKTTKLPIQELSAKKMFHASELAAVMDYLLSVTESMEKSSIEVQFVLQLGKQKWIEAQKVIKWEQTRLLARRPSHIPEAHTSSANFAHKILNFEDLQASIQHWSKNTATIDANSFGPSIAKLVLDHSDMTASNARKIHQVLWKGLKDASERDWMKKAIDLDKFVSCTYAAQHKHFYPILSEQISSEMASKTGDVRLIAIVVATIASHDRKCDSDFISCLWSSFGSPLQFSQQHSFFNIVSFEIELFRFITARFKSVAIKKISNLSSPCESDVLEPASKRMAILDEDLAFYLVWISSSCEKGCKLSAKFAHQFSGLSSQLSQLMGNKLIQSSLPKLVDMSLPTMVAFDARFEHLESICVSDASLLSKEALSAEEAVSSLGKVYTQCDTRQSPNVSKAIISALIEVSQRLVSPPTPSSTPNAVISKMSASNGTENADPNTKKTNGPKNSITRMLKRNNSGSSLQRSMSMGKSLVIESERQETSDSGENWLLSLLEHLAVQNGSDIAHVIGLLVDKIDDRWWVATNTNPTLFNETSFNRTFQWMSEKKKTLKESALLTIITATLRGLATCKKPKLSNVVSLLRASFPNLVIFMSCNMESLRENLTKGLPKRVHQLKELFQLLENVVSFSLGLGCNPMSLCQMESFIEASLPLCAYQVLHDIETRKTTVEKVLSFLSKSLSCGPSLFAHILDLACSFDWSHFETIYLELGLGLTKIPESAPLFEFLVHERACSDSCSLIAENYLKRAKLTVSHIVSYENTFAELNSVDEATKKRWVKSFLHIVDILAYSLSWRSTVPGQEYSAQESDTLATLTNRLMSSQT